MKLTEIMPNIDMICKEYNISDYDVHPDGTVDVHEPVYLIKKTFGQKLPLKFGKIIGSFNCSESPNLISLEGAPTSVTGDFYCYDCPNLVSLKHAPTFVGGGFYCFGCEKLTSLKGIPLNIGGALNCSFCSNLTKLEYLESINKNLNINYTPITNLLAVFQIDGLTEIEYNNRKITQIINKHLKNPDRDDGMFQCRQELKDAGFGEYARLK